MKKRAVFTREEISELMQRLKEQQKAEKRDFETVEEKRQRREKENSIFEEERF